MSLNIIDKLCGLNPEERVIEIQKIYDKNLAFFERKFPALLEVVQKVECPYGMNITENFLEIYDERTGALAHPDAGLDVFAKMLGDWTHATWNDLFNFNVVVSDKYPLHHAPIKNFYRELITNFPEYLIRYGQKKINLKEIEGDKRFSPPCVFLGIFHGLHIDYFLSRTDLAYFMFIEPDQERFEVSCYFLDYEEIHKRFGNLYICVGYDTSLHPLLLFFSNYHVSRIVWTRVLPGYVHEKNAYFLEALKTYQTSLSSIIFPVDYEIRGIEQCEANIKSKHKLLTSRSKLSDTSRILVVASGPSLKDDLPWIKRNQKYLIIFAIQTAVRPLLEFGIQPDFQFSLETVGGEQVVKCFELSRGVPFVSFAKAPQSLIDAVDTVLLCGTTEKAFHVKFAITLESTTPSSGNLAFAFAGFCRPKEIYMAGCDLGHIPGGDIYVQGTVHDTDNDSGSDNSVKNQAGYGAMSQALAEPNFTSTGPIQTNPFLTHTRISIENVIESVGAKTKVINLSNGARVKGAAGIRSQNLKLKGKSQKNKDIEKILSFFKPAEQDVNWYSYEDSGEKMVGDFKKRFLSNLELDIFDWRSFSKAVDSAIQDAIGDQTKDVTDKRAEVFERFLIDLLLNWYVAIIFFDDMEKAEKVYRFGFEKLKAIVENLEWPAAE